MSKPKKDSTARNINLLPAWLPWLLIVIGVAGLAFSAILIFTSLRTAGNLPEVSLEAMPSSAKPTQQEIDDYHVAADVPRYISIPAIGVGKTRIFGLGLKGNQIASPSNIYDAGWYNSSAKPAQPGAMFVFGHKSSWQANGVFHDLSKLQVGDTISVTSGDGTNYTYQVAATKTYAHDKVDMAAVLSAVDPSKPGLNLMTCTGNLIEGTNEFNERFVVFATRTN